MSIADKIVHLQERIHSAAVRAGRNTESIALMAVTKTVPPERIREAHAAGLRLFGENRVQEFAAKAEALRDLEGAQWYMIGHLQTNKAAQAAKLFRCVDSLDSLRLANKLNSSATALGKKLPVLIEVNIGGEQAKSGVAPGSDEMERILQATPSLTSLEFRGLMTVPPYNDDPEQSRRYFRKMRALFDDIAKRKLPAVRMDILSMGMSHDFEVAIEEGSTCVRIGTAIFGERPPRRGKA
jgi:pyridoxal phosphate enzyme (YggS family)